MEITKYIHSEIAKMAPFVNYSDDVVNPLFIWYMKPEYAKNAKWTLYDLQAKLQQSGWMVPAYTLPENIQNYVVMRVVVRQGFSRDMADMLLATSTMPSPNWKNWNIQLLPVWLKKRIFR